MDPKFPQNPQGEREDSFDRDSRIVSFETTIRIRRQDRGQYPSPSIVTLLLLLSRDDRRTRPGWLKLAS